MGESAPRNDIQRCSTFHEITMYYFLFNTVDFHLIFLLILKKKTNLNSIPFEILSISTRIKHHILAMNLRLHLNCR